MMGNFRITGIETTQSIQTFESPPLQGTTVGAPDNSVPLVAERRTILRVYVADARPGSRLFAYLPYGSPAPFGPQPTLYSNQIVAPPMPSDRRRTNQSMQIALPPQPAGTQTYTIRVVETDPTFVHPPREAPPVVLTLTFLARRMVRIRLVRIQYLGRGLNLPPISVRNFWDSLDVAHRILPVRMPGFEVVRESVNVYDGDFTQISPEAHNTNWPGYAANRGTTGSLLNIMDGLAAVEALPADVIYIGIFPSGANNSPWAGWAVGRWIISELDGMTLAHEIAHKLCVPRHAPCGGPANIDPAFPKFANLPDASIGDVGFDPSGVSTTHDPAVVKDLMSYCDPKWISAYNYQKVLNCLTPPRVQQPKPPPFPLPDTVPLVLVRFPPNRWIKVDLPHFPNPPRPGPPVAKGPVRATVFDEDGLPLAFTTGRIEASSSEGELDDARIALDIPWPANGRHLEVRIGEQLIWKHSEQGKPPTLAVRWPTARQLRRGAGRITWDTSGDIDYVVVRASSDGGETWTANVLPGTAKELVLHRGLFASGSDCRLDIAALRGFASARAASKAFSVEPGENAVLILSPSDGETLEEGVSSRFEAIAHNSQARVEWHSDRDGLLGRDAFSLFSSLSEGPHVIEARSLVPFEAPTRVHVVVKRRSAKLQRPSTSIREPKRRV